MPRSVPDKVYERALQMYLEGGSTYTQIAERLESEGHKVSSKTVAQWSREEGWKEMAIEVSKKSTAAVADKVVETRRFSVEKDVEDVRKIREKASTELEFQTFKDAGQASNAMIKAIESERTMMEGLISRTLVESVIDIIQEEVKDIDTKDRIRARLLELLKGLSEYVQ